MSWKLSRPVLRGRSGGNVTLLPDFGRAPEKLREFADTVTRLQETERLGLVKKLYIQTRDSSGDEQIDSVMVVGGLTEDGRRLLANL